MAQLRCIVVTPEETAMEQESSFVVVPLFDGELGVAPGHSPLIGRLGFGELRLTASDGTKSRFYVDGGFVQVANDVVTVLTGKTVPARDLDVAVAEEQLADAMKRPVNTDELLELRERAVLQARSQIRIAQR
ncbi:MAG: ATP synthase F1 subunit epsilon [Planctomycetaceae bacterium]|nr:ATP synthase F1 subunit epsilon [Planctomycetaceae bacterium]